MKIIPNGVSRTFARQILKTQKASPTILFAAGVVGVGATVFLACKATLKLEETLEDIQLAIEVEGENGGLPQEAQKARVKGYITLAKLYAPSAAVGVVAIGCLTGSHHILSKRNVALTAAYATLERGYSEYRKRVQAELGEDKERELRFPTETTEVKTNEGKTIKVQSHTTAGVSIYARFFDEYSRNWSNRPEVNRLFVNAQQSYANDLLRSRGHLFLNEVYDMLGLERSPEGQVVGWVYNKKNGGDGFVDFGVFTDPYKGQRFVNGDQDGILLDFNVDGVVWDLI